MECTGKIRGGGEKVKMKPKGQCDKKSWEKLLIFSKVLNNENACQAR